MGSKDRCAATGNFVNDQQCPHETSFGTNPKGTTPKLVSSLDSAHGRLSNIYTLRHRYSHSIHQLLRPLLHHRFLRQESQLLSFDGYTYGCDHERCLDVRSTRFRSPRRSVWSIQRPHTLRIRFLPILDPILANPRTHAYKSRSNNPLNNVRRGIRRKHRNGSFVRGTNLEEERRSKARIDVDFGCSRNTCRASNFDSTGE